MYERILETSTIEFTTGTWFNLEVLIVYGITGFTGQLVARELARRKIPFTAAGRRRVAIRDALAKSGAPSSTEIRVFGLDEKNAIVTGLQGASVVLNCAGPFASTAVPLARGSITLNAHYLDLAGEVNEHETIRALADEARVSGSMLLPGVGFGCVPTEIAAAKAADLLGERPSHLTIAYETKGTPSRGTLETVLRNIHHEGVQRREGVLVATRPGAEKKRMKLGSAGTSFLITNPWRADLIAAFMSTASPNISTFATFPLPARVLMALPKFTESRAGRWIIDRIISSGPEGPSEPQMAAGSTRILVVAASHNGRTTEVRVKGPDAYLFTARTAAEITKRVFEGSAHPGFAVPSQVMDLVGLASIEGVRVEF